MNISFKYQLAFLLLYLCMKGIAQEKLYSNSFNLSDVRLLPGVIKQAQDVNTQNLRKYDVDRQIGRAHV